MAVFIPLLVAGGLAITAGTAALGFIQKTKQAMEQTKIAREETAQAGIRVESLETQLALSREKTGEDILVAASPGVIDDFILFAKRNFPLVLLIGGGIALFILSQRD